jgi:hypothetical protein
MAITQKHIVNKIPQIIGESHFEILLLLRTLALNGWGEYSKLYELLDSLVKLNIECSDEYFIFFDGKKRTYQKTTRHDDALIITYKNLQNETVFEVNNRAPN